MSFLSMTFLIFFVVFISLYHIFSLSKKALFIQQLLILVASIVFYCFSDVRFLPFLIYVTLISWLGGLYSKNKVLLSFFIILDIIPLLFFKYAPNSLHLNIIFPLGISFFTFQSIGYIVDCYTKKINIEKNIFIVAEFICFFPVISSGPIQRANNLIPQLKTIHHFDYLETSDGLKLFAWGMFKKLCIADNIAIYVNHVYGNLNESYGISILFATLLYAFQIYCDFSGYSDMAIGLAKYMGFDVGKNFDHPYLAKSISEFWRRWHISLSSWLRDYIYIPLGGSRVAVTRIYINLFITFLVSGVWHGSSWNFIIWGLLHGLYQSIGRAGKNIIERIKIPSWLRIVFTFCLVTFAWIFFRAENFQQAIIIIKKIGSVPAEIIKIPNIINSIGIKNYVKTIILLDVFGGINKIIFLFCMLCIFCIVNLYTYKENGLEIIRRKPLVLRWILYVILCTLLLPALVTNTNSQFLYFSF